MRRVWRLLGLYLPIAGVLCADGITGCVLDGNSLNLNQCYSANTLFTAPLTLTTLNWDVAFGEAAFSNQNPHGVGILGPWTTNIAGVNIGVNVGADYSSGGGAPKLARVDNEVYIWDPGAGRWIPPQFSADPTLRDDFTYAGHFSAPGPAHVAGDGEELLAMFDNATYGTGSYVITFDKGVHAAGFLVSVAGIGSNTNFDATIKAYDRNSLLVATYLINTTGVGGLCTTLTNTLNGLPNPSPCNNAPFIGIRAPGDLSSQQIYRIVVSATTLGNLDSVLLDSLQFQLGDQEAPEPAVIFLCGAGLILIGVLRRKRHAAGGSQR